MNEEQATLMASAVQLEEATRRLSISNQRMYASLKSIQLCAQQHPGAPEVQAILRFCDEGLYYGEPQ